MLSCYAVKCLQANDNGASHDYISDDVNENTVGNALHGVPLKDA